MADSTIEIRMKGTSWNLLRERANNNKDWKGGNGEKRRNDLVKINLPGYLPGAHRVLTVEIYGVSRGPLVTGPPEALRASLFHRQRNVFFKNRDRSNERDHCYYPPPPPPSSSFFLCPRIGSRQRARIFPDTDASCFVVHRCSSRLLNPHFREKEKAAINNATVNKFSTLTFVRFPPLVDETRY